MKNIIYLKTVILFLFSLSFHSCSKKNNLENLSNEKSAPSFQMANNRMQELANSSEVKKMFEMQAAFLEKIELSMKKGYTLNEIKEVLSDAIIYGKEKEAYLMIFGSEQEGISYFKNLQTSKKNVIERYPELLSIANNLDKCVSCNSTSSEDINKFFINFEVYNKVRKSGDLKFNNRSAELGDEEIVSAGESVPVCGSYWQQTKLIACASICGASTAGVGAALCGWGCWCMLCSKNSALADVIC